MIETDEYYFMNQSSGERIGQITSLTICYELICPKCGTKHKKNMRLSTNDLRPKSRTGSLKCKKCKHFDTFFTYFGVKLHD